MRRIPAVLMLLVLSACSGGGHIPQPFNASTDEAMRASLQSLPASTAPCGTSRVYVADYERSDIEIYDQGVANPAPCGKISTGISSPEGIYVNAKGTLFVTNFLSSQITVYRHGAKKPELTISTSAPAYDVFVGKGGVVYAAVPATDSVLEYAANTTVPVRTLSINGAPYGVATDSSNNLYVSYLSNADGISHVEKFKPRATTGTNLGFALPFSGEVKIDSANDVILGDRNENDTIFIYPPGATSPSRSIATAANPVDFALNNAENTIYVSGLGSVQAIDYTTGAGITTISNGLVSPSGVAAFPPPAY